MTCSEKNTISVETTRTSSTSIQNTEPTETIPEKQYIFDFTEKERLLFEQIISAEANSWWSLEGFMLLAQTTVDQLQNGYWGETLTDVLTYPNNYCVYRNGRYLTVPINPVAVEAVGRILSGERVLEDTILYYCTEKALQTGGFHTTRNKIIKYENVWFFN